MAESAPKTLLPVVSAQADRIQLVRGGGGYFGLLEELFARAMFTIHVQVYILDEDRTGRNILNSLMGAARRGVSVYLVVDGYASQRLSEEMEAELGEAGVNFIRFEPLFKGRSFYFGRRLHHKVVVVDGKRALVGGMNICDRYNEVDGVLPWLDYALYVEGRTAAELEQICSRIWNKGDSNRKVYSGLAGRTEGNVVLHTQADVRIRINDWAKGKQEIKQCYLRIIRAAREQVTIACSYFLPGRSIRKALKAAVQRGVQVRVIVAGKSDVWIAKQAERFLYRWLLQSGIVVYEYQKSNLHAKIAAVDGWQMTIGSYNVNNISTYASIELNLEVRSRTFVTGVEKELQDIIEADSVQITPEAYRVAGRWWSRLWQRLCYEAIKTILYLFTFYFRTADDRRRRSRRARSLIAL